MDRDEERDSVPDSGSGDDLSLTPRIVVLRQALPSEHAAVRMLFHRLHAFNSRLDPMFALADGWERVLDEHLVRERASGDGLTLVAWEDGHPVGLLMMGCHVDPPVFRYRRWAEVLALYVAEEMRGTTLAEQMVTAGAAWAVDRGYKRVQLFVTASNHRAKRFYQRVGFRPVQEIWRLDLTSGPRVPYEDLTGEVVCHGQSTLLSTDSQQFLTEGDRTADNGDPVDE